MWRLIVAAAAFLAVSGCGSSGPAPSTTGSRLTASLAATWPAAGPPRQTAFSRDGRFLATSDASGDILVRETRGWKVVDQLSHPDGATSVVFSRDGSHLFSSGYDGTVREWDLATRRLVRIVGRGRGTVWTLAMSPDGSRLAGGGEDAIVRIWNLDPQGASEELRGHTRNIWTLRFSPDGKRLASGSFDATVRLWDVASGKLLKTLNGHKEAIVGLAFSPDGRLLASGGDDSTIRFWRAFDGVPLRTIDNGRHVDSVAFSPDGKWVVTGGHPHGTAGDLWHQLGGNGAGDSVRFWRVADGALVDALSHPDDVMWVAISPDGHWLLTSCEDRHFRLWRLQQRG